MQTVKKILYSLITLFLLGSIIESLLFFITDSKEKRNIQIVKNLHQDAWIYYRDQSLPKPFVKKQENIWTTHPTYRKRGLPDTKITNPKRGLRLLALGGSTTVGIPFEKEIGGFPQLIEEILEEQQVQVVNAAVPGMASRSFSKITAQIQDLEIDAVLVYAGNNEHSSTMYYHCLEQKSKQTSTQRILHRLQTYRLLKEIFSNKVSIDIDVALERQEDCLSNVALQVHKKQSNRLLRQDMLRDEAVQNFEKNLSDIVSSHASIPFFVAIPPINYQTPPKLSLLSPNKSKEDLQKVERELQTIQSLWEQRLYGKIRRASEKLYSDHPEYAHISYHLGMSEIRVGKEDLGLKHLQDALEQDWQPERVTSDMQKVIKKICAKFENAICVDVDKRFKEIAVFKETPGKDLFIDYCHPTKELGTNEIAYVFLKSLRYHLGIKNDNKSQDDDQ